MKHASTTVEIGGYVVDVDTEIVELIEVMNTIPGMKTLNSCQCNQGQAYVQFAGPRCVMFLALMTELMASTFAKHGTTFTIKKQKYGHLFSIEVGDSFTMRWGQYTYPLVLEAAREAARRIPPSP